MAGRAASVSNRMNAGLKAQAGALFAEPGMNLSAAFNSLARQSPREGRVPVDISLSRPNEKTIVAMLEAERIAKDPSAKGCTDLDRPFTDLKA